MTCQPKDKLMHTEYKNKRFIQAKTQEDHIQAPTLISTQILSERTKFPQREYSLQQESCCNYIEWQSRIGHGY